MHRCRAWFGTLNNYTEAQDEGLQKFLAEKAVWGIRGKEVGAKGTPHLQWACIFKHPQTFKGLQKVLKAYGCECHIEMTRSNEAARRYCKKEGDWKEFGECPKGAGHRTDLDRLNEAISRMRDGEIDEIWDLIDADNTAIVYKHHRALALHKAHLMRKKAQENKEKFDVTLCVGPAGSGKSKWIADNYPGAYWVTYGDYGQQTWFDGYTGQSTIVLDDYKGNLPYSKLLRLCDRYKQELQVKGGSLPALHTRVVISSIKETDEWYDYSTGCKSKKEIDRRITRTIKFPINPLERRLVGLTN